MEEIVVRCASHGIETGDQVRLMNGLPLGLAVETDYYAIAFSKDAIKLATSYQNAIDGIAIVGCGICGVKIEGN